MRTVVFKKAARNVFVPLFIGLLMWLVWMHLIGWEHTRRCIGDGLDAGRASAGADLTSECRGPTIVHPFRGLKWAWPPTWEVGYAIVGALLITVGLALTVRWRLRRTRKL